MRSFALSFNLWWKNLIPSLPKTATSDPQISFENKRFYLVLASLAINILALALPIMTLQIYDRILVNYSLGTLKVLAFSIVIVVILELILRLSRSYVIGWAGASYEHSVACNFMRHMLAADLSKLKNHGAGKQLQQMVGIGKLRDFFSGQAFVTLIDLPFVFLFLGVISYLAGWLVVVPILLLTVFTAIAWHLGIRLKKALEDREEQDEHRLGFIIEKLSGIHTVKSLGLEAAFQRHYNQLQYQSSRSNYFVTKISNAASNYGMLFTQAMIIGIITVGAPMAMQNQLTLGTLIACILLSGRIMSPIQRALGIWTRYQDFEIAKTAISETFALPIIEHSSTEELGEKEGRLQLNHVTFSHNLNEPTLFNQIDLNLKRGDSISISGDRSCGKTTLLKLMMGIYQPIEGNILVNGVNALHYPSEELVKHIGYMAMEGTIFSGTIRENLNAFGAIPDEQVSEIIKLLELDHEINILPDGFDTKLEGGVADVIPPGLKQRITLARTLAPKPRILLFDNADRSLDRDGYNHVYHLLGRLKGKATMVIVSDDRNIKRLADKEYILADGNLVPKDYNETYRQHDMQPYQELRL